MQGRQQGQSLGRSVVEVHCEAPRRHLTHQGEQWRFFEHALDIDAAMRALQNG